MTERLDELLDRIAGEPLSKQQSSNEREFFEKLKDLRLRDRQQYVRYIQIYNEVQNSKYD